MTLVYRGAITKERTLLFPATVRNGVVLRASLTSDDNDSDDNDEAYTPEPALKAELNINRQDNKGDYRFSIKASQPALILAHYEAMGAQGINAELQWHGIDPHPTITAGNAIAARKLEELTKKHPSRTAPIRPPANTMTLNEVYQRHGDFRYHIFPHDILTPIINTLREQITPAERLEGRVQYLPQQEPFDMTLRAYIDISARELWSTTIPAITHANVAIPFLYMEVAYLPTPKREH